MTANKVGIGVVALGGVSIAGGVLAHGGIGSCGPYGAGGPYIVLGALLAPLGFIVLVLYWSYRAVMHLRR